MLEIGAQALGATTPDQLGSNGCTSTPLAGQQTFAGPRAFPYGLIADACKPASQPSQANPAAELLASAKAFL